MAPNVQVVEKKGVRIATFNVALNRPKAGQLLEELQQGEHPKIRAIARVIQIVRPDILLINELDEAPATLEAFQKNFLEQSIGGTQPIEYPYRFTADVNTGQPSGIDLNDDGSASGPEDAFGYGKFPGQYSMAVLSRYPIETEAIRTFQKFLWRDLEGMTWPTDPETGESFYSDDAKEVFRLSSKSHWDVPIQIGGRTVHLLASHPTPPVFDGPEDRNGLRNSDEIRFWQHYIDNNDNLYDDRGDHGGLALNASFVIAGDLNSDPQDGGSENGILRLLDHPRVNSRTVPSSDGALEASKESGKANLKHLGPPEHDTGDFNDDQVGNLRIDYVLPSSDLQVVDAKVFWPTTGTPHADLASASDHHLVWIDVTIDNVE